MSSTKSDPDRDVSSGSDADLDPADRAPIAESDDAGPIPFELEISRPGTFLLELLTVAQWSDLGPEDLPGTFQHHEATDCYARVRIKPADDEVSDEVEG
jgi:hypothetical protein